jgi:hypothetical protein
MMSKIHGLARHPRACADGHACFKPLEDVNLTEGAKVEVHVPAEDSMPLKSLRDSPLVGMWADRDDIPDGVAYEDRIRQPRY